MNPATSKGASVSFNNTPQAVDDFFAAAFTGFTEDNPGTFVLDVMGNDSGGKAKSLYSLDDGVNSAGANGDLLQRDSAGSANRSLHGATIKITADGKISYDASTWDAAFAADLQHLGAGQFATDSFTYAIQLGNGTLSWATATVQIAGVNDAPVITSSAADAQVAELADTTGSATTDAAAGTVSFTDADFSDTHTASAVANGSGYIGTFSLDPITQDSGNGATGSVGWHFSVVDGALDFLAEGQQLVQSYTVTVDDGHGGTAQQVVTVTITGSNDAPVIGGQASASLKEDDPSLWLASGQLTATDPDHGATQAWSIAGATPALQDYNFALDEFKITRNGAAFFDDTFSDGVAPPKAPNIIGGGPVSYGVGPAGASFFEVDGRALLVGAPNGVVSPIVIGGFSTVGQSATLLTDSSNNLNGAGLKANMTFAVEGRFDLVLPSDVRDQYAIRLSDNTQANTGDDIVSLAVRRDADGVHVTLSELNFAGLSSTVLQQIDLNPAPGDDQIVLRLAHPTANSTDIAASFDLLNHGVVDSTTNFTATGHAFDNENWVQAQFVANGLPESDSVLVGTYSTLTVDQNGEWVARVRNGAAAVQALAEGQTVTETFNVQVTDDQGAVATKPVVVTVTGTNDAPNLQAPVASAPVLTNAGLTVADALAFTDVDLNDTHTVAFTPQGSGYVGDFTADVTTEANGQGTITTSFHLTKDDVVNNGGTFPDHQDYLVTVNDRHGGTSSQTVSIPLSEILSNAGGGGSTQNPPVFINTNTFTIGHDVGQVLDNPFLLDPNVVDNPPTFLPDGTYLSTQGMLDFSDPDGGFHQVSVDLAHAHILHNIREQNGVVHSLPGTPVGVNDGIWQVNVQEPGHVQWTYALSENAIRGMASGEWESIFVPITISEPGVGQPSTETVRIDVFGADEPTSMLAPDVVLTANTDITPYLLPIDSAMHVQTLNYSLSEAPGVTGSTSHDILTGTIPYVDPDLLDRPDVSMQLNDPGVPLTPEVAALRNGFSYTVESFGNYGLIHWTYDVPDSALDFLAEGSSLGVSANFSVGTLVGGAFTTVNISLQGANDAPVIPGDTITFADVALHTGTSGSFNMIDPDWYPDGHSVTFVPHDPNNHGSLYGGTPGEGGQGGSEPISWFYSADYGPGTLVAGQHDVWDVIVQDNSGAKATHTLDFHLI